jgi:hypothetical protein
MDSTKLFSGRNVLTSFIVFMAAYLLVGGSWVGLAAVNSASGGAAVPDMLFSYDPARLGAMFEALGPEGRAAYLSMNTVDFFFAGAYGTFYFIALGWIAGRLFPKVAALRLVGLVGVLGALCDETENAIFRLAASGGSIDGAPASIAATASTAKALLAYPTMALVLIGLAAVAVSAVARKPRKSS